MVRVEAFIGIENHRLQCVAARLSTLDTRLTELVEDAFIAFSREHFDVDRTTPVVGLLVSLAIVVGEESDGCVVQIFVVGLDGEDGGGHGSWVEDVRLSCADG